MKTQSSRRKFLRQVGGSSLLLAAGSLKTLAIDDTRTVEIPWSPKISQNDKIRIATIGMGIMGHADTDLARFIGKHQLIAVQLGLEKHIFERAVPFARQPQ